MHSLVAVAIGIVVHTVTSAACGHNANLGAVLSGIWNGVILFRSIQEAGPNSFQPYFQPAVAFLLDVVMAGSLIRPIIFLMGCGLGVVLADIGPDVWYEIGGEGVIRDLDFLWNDLSNFLLNREGTKHTVFIKPRRNSSPSSSGSTTPLHSVAQSVWHTSTLPEIPGSFPAHLEEQSVIESQDSRPLTPLTIEQSFPELEAQLRSPSPPPSHNDGIEQDYVHAESSQGEDNIGNSESTPRAIPARVFTDSQDEISPIALDEPELLTPPPSASPDIPSIPGEDEAADLSTLTPKSVLLPDIAPDEDVAGPSSVHPNPVEDQTAFDDIETIISAPESVLSGGPKNAVLLRAAELRRQADATLRERHRLEQEKRRAEIERRPFDAIALKLETEELDKEARKLHERAERRYYHAHNTGKAAWTIDVHGLKPAEAIRRTERELHEVHRSGGNRLRVIVGQGHHSKGKIPVLKLALLRELERQHIPAAVDYYNPGVVNISIR